MKLSQTRQIDPTELSNMRLDAVIAASGYEARATHAITTLELPPTSSRVAFGFEDRISQQRKTNDAILTSAEVKIVTMDGNSSAAIRNYVSALISQSNSDRPQLFVDYSSMTRAWYAGIIEAIMSIKEKKSVSCIFSYSPAAFTPPSHPSPNAIVGPIAGFCGLDVPEKPSALVIGLGYERERALGIFEYSDPAVAFAFYTDPALDDRYTSCVVRNNAPLLHSLGRANVFRHPLTDLQRISSLLGSLYSALTDEYRVVLAPLGIKPFSLICLLLASRFADIDVWRISPGQKAPPHERKPAGPVILLRADFE